MNVQRSPTSTLERPDIYNGSETRLHGRWLLLARVSWVIVTLLILGLNIGAIPRYYAVLQTVCAAPVNCFDDHPHSYGCAGTACVGDFPRWLCHPYDYIERPGGSDRHYTRRAPLLAPVE